MCCFLNNTIFILDTYNPYAPKEIQDLVRFKFYLHDCAYAVYEVELEWGKVKMNRPIDENITPDFYYFSSLEEAKKYIKFLKRINR